MRENTRMPSIEILFSHNTMTILLEQMMDHTVSSQRK